MNHPFSNMFEKALKKSTEQDNRVLKEAEMLRRRGYATIEIYEVLQKLHHDLIQDSDVAIVAEALEEFGRFL